MAIDNLSHRKFATDVMQLAEMVEGYEEAETHDHEALLKWPQVRPCDLHANIDDDYWQNPVPMTHRNAILLRPANPIKRCGYFFFLL